MRVAPFFVFAFCFALSAPAAAGPIEDCDRLAADPGVPLSAIALPDAREACAAALDLDDAAPRLMHLYARTLEASGETAAALRYYGWAAEDGHPPAHLALARLGADRPDQEAAPDLLARYAASAGDSVGELAALVARETRALPHGAALRPPETTLALRRGGEPDLARLLRALIMARDPAAQTRYGVCVPEAGASRDPPPARPAGEAVFLMSQAIEEAAASPELRPLELEVLARLREVWRAILAEGRAEAEALAGDIRAIGLDVQSGEPARLAAQPMVAVEAFEEGVWRAWDPARGIPFDPASCTRYRTEAVFPAELTPRLRLIMRAQEAAEEDGALSSRVILDADLPFAGDAVLAFAEAWGIAPPDAPAERGAAFYTPILISGAASAFGESLRLPRPPSAEPETGETAAQALGEAIEAFDGLAPPPAVVEAPDLLRGLEVEIRLDLAGSPGAARRLTLLERPDPARPLADANGDYLDLQQLVGLLALDGAQSAPPEEASEEVVTTRGGVEALARRSGQAMAGFDGLRQAIMAEISSAPAPAPQSLGLLATVWTPTPPGAEGEDPGLRLRNQMWRGFEPAAEGSADPAGAAAAWAVASVLAERLVLQLGVEDFSAEALGPDAVSLWSALRAAGGEARVVTEPASLAALSPEAKARAEAFLARSLVLLAPVDPLTADEADLVWWILDPQGGVVEDEFADGGRQAAAEESTLNKDVACRNVGFFAQVGAQLARLVAPAAILLAVTGGGGDAGKSVVKFVQGVAKTQEETEKRRRALELASRACAGKSGGPGP